MAARGTGQSHKGRVAVDGEVPTVVTDYGYLNPSEEDKRGALIDQAITFLAMDDCLPAGTGCYGASSIPAKGKDEFCTRVSIDFFNHVGH